MTLHWRKGASTRPLPDATLDALIHAEQISMLYRQLPTSIAGNMTGALMLAGVLIGERPLATIFGWLACITIFQSYRLGLSVAAGKRASQ